MIRRWLTAVVALQFAAPAVLSAHPTLHHVVPARGAHLAAVPRELRLTFAPPPELTFSRLQLLGPGGAAIALGPIRMDSVGMLVATIDGAVSAGTYTVTWRVAGADGHPVRGRYSFTIAPGAAGLGASTPSPSARHHDPTSLPEGQGFDAGSPVYVAIRWLQFTALLIVIGAVAFRGVVLSRVDRMQSSEAGASSPILAVAAVRAANLGLWASIGLSVIAVARLYVQSYAMHGPSDALNAGLVGTMVSQTMWGWGWILQIAGVAIATTGFARARRAHRGGWFLATLGIIALAFTPALSGHAAASPEFRSAAIVSDALHVIGAGGWLGSLLFVIGVGVPAALRLSATERGPAIADLANAFSPTALVFAGVTAATGVFAVWLHLATWTALWETAYGRTLLVKLAVLLVLAATGAYNWLRVRPSLGDVEGARRIRRSARLELAVGLVVLAVTALLVATPPSAAG